MITKETLLKDLYKDTPLEKYRKLFYYGFDGPEWENGPIGYYQEVWRNEETVRSLNEFQSFYEQGLVEQIPLRKDNENISLTLVKQPKRSKLALVISGGGYCSVATAVEGLPIGSLLYEKGFTVAHLTYSIQKDARNDNSYKDLISAVTYLFNNRDRLNIDIKNYIIGGCSAGAHLAARIGTDNMGYRAMNLPKPGLIFLAYPVIDFGRYGHKGSIDSVLGSNPSQKQIDEISIQKHVDKNFPPVYMWQCDKDNIVDVKNSQMMNEALNAARIKHIYKTFDSTAHGWGNGKGTLAENWVNEMLEFYNSLVK